MPRAFRLACLLLICHMPAAWAQQCAGPLRLIVGLSAGGGMDAVARMLAESISARFRQPIIVENKVGAAGNIAAESVAKAALDGCTIIIRGNEHNINPLIYSNAHYKPQDFTPIVRAVSGPAVIVAAANQPYKTLPAMIEYAKTHPGKLSYSSAGIGTANHVFAERFLRAAGIDVLHVPYKGAAPAMADTVGGVVPLSVGSVAAALPFINSGKLIPLAVTGQKRWPTLPDVPTLAEAGYPEATMTYWMGFLAPVGTPGPIIDRLNEQFRIALSDTTIRDRLLEMGYQPEAGSAQEFDRFLRDDERISRKLMQELKLKVD